MIRHRPTHALLFVSLLGCGSAPQPTSHIHQVQPISHHDTVSFPLQLIEDPWVHRRWLEKIMTRAGYGGHLGGATFERLAQLPPEEAVDELINGLKFQDTVLDFGMYFSGVKNGPVRDGMGNFNFRIYSFPSAISAAKAVATDGDFLTLFNFDQPIYTSPLGTITAVRDRHTGEYIGYDWPQDQKRQYVFESARLVLQSAYDEFRQEPNTTIALARGCENGTEFISELFNLSSTVTSHFSEKFSFPIDLACGLGTITHSEIEDFFFRMTMILPQFFLHLQTLTPEVYQAATPAEIRALQGFPEMAVQDIIPLTSWATLSNSSTNFNRKRASYILKRYFCDDLTPVAVEMPDSDHSQGRHGSDPSCQACHYKLDPMAGFFRNIGAFGGDFSGHDRIVFDDGAVKDRLEYEKAWRDDQQNLKVGYIRSLRHPDQNAWGNDLRDLFQIIKTAPEARQCLVKKTFAYFAGEDQMADGGYLDYLTQTFNSEAAVNSARAYKKLVKTILLSQTMRQPDPDSTQCYDHDPRQSTPSDLPCEVAFVIRKNCETCHNNGNNRGGLSLDRWLTTAPGQEGFVHVKNGRQLATRDSLALILERIETPDRNRRMPLAQEMKASERETLYLWLQEMLHP